MAFGDLGKAKLAGDLGHHALVRGIAISVHEHDRDGVVALSARVGERGPRALRVGRRLDRAVGAHALVDLDDAGIKLLGLYDVFREYARARLVANLERIAKAARGHQQRALAAPLEQSVGGDGCSHLDGANGSGRNRLARSEPQEAADRLNRRVRVSRTFGQKLDRMQPPARVAADYVGERAAAIDPEVPGSGWLFFGRAPLRVHVWLISGSGSLFAASPLMVLSLSQIKRETWGLTNGNR